MTKKRHVFSVALFRGFCDLARHYATILPSMDKEANSCSPLFEYLC